MLFIFCSFANDEEIYEDKLKTEYDDLQNSNDDAPRNPTNKNFKNESLKENISKKEPKDKLFDELGVLTKKQNKEKSETSESIGIFEEDFIIQRKKKSIFIPVSIGLSTALIAGLSIKYFCFSKKISETKDDNWKKIDKNLEEYINKLRDCKQEVNINRKDIYYLFLYLYKFENLEKINIETLTPFNFLSQNLYISLIEEDGNVEKFQQSAKRMTSFYWTLKYIYSNIFHKNDFAKERDTINNISKENNQKNDSLNIKFQQVDNTTIKDSIFQLMNIDDSKKYIIWKNLEEKFPIPDVTIKVENKIGFIQSIKNFFSDKTPVKIISKKETPKLKSKDIKIIDLINNIIITTVFKIICEFPKSTGEGNTNLQNYLNDNNNMKEILEKIFNEINNIVKSAK